MIVGANIRAFRRDAGLTQEGLADRAGLAMRYLAGIERGEENPSLSFLIRIAEALEVHPSRLFENR